MELACRSHASVLDLDAALKEIEVHRPQLQSSVAPEQLQRYAVSIPPALRIDRTIFPFCFFDFSFSLLLSCGHPVAIAGCLTGKVATDKHAQRIALPEMRNDSTRGTLNVSRLPALLALQDVPKPSYMPTYCPPLPDAHTFRHTPVTTIFICFSLRSKDFFCKDVCLFSLDTIASDSRLTNAS